MKSYAISSWIEANSEYGNFEESLLRLLSFACVEWVRRENGVKKNPEEALALFLGAGAAAFPIGRWIQNPRNFALEIGNFCEKSRTDALPDSLKRNFPDLLDLRGVKCPNNSLQSRLFLAGAPAGHEYRIYLDDGAPIENVPGGLLADGYEISAREKKEDFWVLNVVKKVDK